jgi:hypothetical protein
MNLFRAIADRLAQEATYAKHGKIAFDMWAMFPSFFTITVHTTELDEDPPSVFIFPAGKHDQISIEYTGTEAVLYEEGEDP